MKRLLIIGLTFVAMLGFSVIVTSAQAAPSAGCTAVMGMSGTVDTSITETFEEGEAISIVVTSLDGGLFDITVDGTLYRDDVPSGEAFSYTMPEDGTITIELSVMFGTGTYSLDCEGAQPEAFDGTLCHIPPGNPAAAHTITVGSPNAVEAHLGHGDTLGPCPTGVQTRFDNPTINITIFVIYATDSIQIYGNCTDECEEVMNTPIVLLINLNLVTININTSVDDAVNDDTGGGDNTSDDVANATADDSEFVPVSNPADYGFSLGEVSQNGLTAIIYYLHPDPNNAQVGVFQINVYDNNTLIDDSILVFITTGGNIVLWTDQSYWDQQLALSQS
ncbi:MAG: hypothetical protein ACFE0Q_18100 [Anaerolineae bacterium]